MVREALKPLALNGSQAADGKVGIHNARGTVPGISISPQGGIQFLRRLASRRANESPFKRDGRNLSALKLRRWFWIQPASISARLPIKGHG